MSQTLNFSLNVLGVRGAILDETFMSVRRSPCNLFLSERFRWRRTEPLVSLSYAKSGRKRHLYWKACSLQKQADSKECTRYESQILHTDSSYARHLTRSGFHESSEWWMVWKQCVCRESVHRSAVPILETYLQV